MQEYLDHLANLEHAVTNRQQEVMLHELRDLQTCMNSCHREFKSGAKNRGEPRRSPAMITSAPLKGGFETRPHPCHDPAFAWKPNDNSRPSPSIKLGHKKSCVSLWPLSFFS